MKPMLHDHYTMIESPEIQTKVEIPHVYLAYIDVFIKAKATRLPPHCDNDCLIKRLPNTQPPCSKVYPLSLAEQKTLEEYIHEAQQGYITPSITPALAGLFFVEKIAGGLRPCIDYRGLNKILIRFPWSRSPSNNYRRPKYL